MHSYRTLQPADVVREVREARFTHGLVCPHCTCTRCHSWGGFAGRRRYRCTGCRRTFSDLTGTPAAYIKRLPEFARYRQCMRASNSVRRAAALIGVNKDTTFRWRHRLLDCMRELDASQLSGYTEIADARFAYLDKAARRTEQPQPRVRRRMFQRPAVWVSFACDRSGAMTAAITGHSRPRFDQIAAQLATRISDDASLLTDGGRFSAHARLARARGAACCLHANRYDVSSPLLHTENVRRSIAEFREWLRPFRGVSTCYLDNYLCWFGALWRAERGHVFAALLHWPLAPPPAAEPPGDPSTIPADSGRRSSEGEAEVAN